MSKAKATVTGIERTLLKDLERVTDRVIAALIDFKFALGQMKDGDADGDPPTNMAPYYGQKPPAASPDLAGGRIQSHSISQNRRLKGQEADFEPFVDPRGVAKLNATSVPKGTQRPQAGCQDGVQVANPASPTKPPTYKRCKLDDERYIVAKYDPYCSERCQSAAHVAAAKKGLRSRWSDTKNRMVMVDVEGNEVEAPPSRDDFTLTRDGLRS